MSEHSHSHEVSHEVVTELIEQNETFALHKSLALLTSEAVDDESYEEAWAEYSAAKKKVVAYTIQKMVGLIIEQVPEVAYVILYEDHSHDAPHGHIEALLDASQHSINLGGDWHDLGWTNEVDEYVWDVYNLGKEYFSLTGGKRRLLIKV